MSNVQIDELRIAVYGQAGSGKTSLLASWYGHLQGEGFDVAHGYRAHAPSVADNTTLIHTFLGMGEGKFPEATVSRATPYKFEYRVRGLPAPALNLTWLDYPGEWWEREPETELERSRRSEAFQNLTGAHFSIYIVDGARYKAERRKYLASVLTAFANHAKSSREDAIAAATTPTAASTVVARLREPQLWAIAMTKADLLESGYSAKSLHDDVVSCASDAIIRLANAHATKSYQHAFLLLSAAEGNDDRVRDLERTLGLAVIAPAALEQVLRDQAGRVDGTRPDPGGPGWFKALKILFKAIDKADDFLPAKYQVLTGLLRVFGLHDVVNRTAAEYRALADAALKERDARTAVANLMHADLCSEEGKRAYFSSSLS